ncbi:MAG TPA: formate dehydrogenase accessory sulfurtransferase FdhD [Paucimonas sp.]|nr:formate dehydrogenase accessory sulfurtransferase FdhD [Paucimonas sp.]HJW56706.1 formate dehydrogenase accessory sulfurtransferase FdhD [Burkholderiaceae bacterium]
MSALSAAPDDPALTRMTVEKWQGNTRKRCEDMVAVETPVALEYNGISHAVMLASPEYLDDFALGFSLSEGILAAPSELFDCDVAIVEQGIRVQMQIAAQRFMALKEHRRNLTGRTGCGLCGTETLQQAIRQPPPVACTATFSAAAIHAGIMAMQTRQHLQQRSGATHAAAWMRADGAIALVREDVGRHNALDKLIGALAHARTDFSSGALLITSRASVEMVQKAATVGIGFMVAISAPTNLAIRLAGQTGVTLLGFARAHSHVVYTHAHRLLAEEPN